MNTAVRSPGSLASEGSALLALGRFLRAYLRSMRLYYAFLTGVAGWIGVAYAQSVAPEVATPPKAVLTLTIMFLAWGINQIINDYLGRREDRINAPHRPMVTGELNPRAAVGLSLVLLGLSAVVSWNLAPLSVVPLLAGVLLNVVYEYAKGIPVLGNVVFGLMMVMCPVFAYLAMTGAFPATLTSGHAGVLLLVALMNGLMTYYTYFKDYQGDKACGKVTAVVLQGLERSRRTALMLSVVPALALWALIGAEAFASPPNAGFLTLFVVTFVLQVATGVLYFRHPTGPRAYFSLVTNFRSCACGQVLLIALFNPALAIPLFAGTYVLIGFLFNLHRDHKA